jgi:hypothetical protein
MEKIVMRSSIICTLHQILLGYQIKDDEMGRAYSMHEGNDICVQIWLESLKGRDHLEDLGIDGQIILKCILGK